MCYVHTRAWAVKRHCNPLMYTPRLKVPPKRCNKRTPTLRFHRLETAVLRDAGNIKNASSQSYGGKYSSVNCNSLQHACSNDRLSKQIKPKELYITHPGWLSGQILPQLHSCLINCWCVVYVLMLGEEVLKKKNKDMSPWAPGKMNTAQQRRRKAVKLVSLCFHVSAVICCHILQLFSFSHCALVVTLLLVDTCEPAPV